MTDFPQHTDSGMEQHSSSNRCWSLEVTDVTNGTLEQPRTFSMSGESNPVSNARKIIAEIENPDVAKQFNELLITIRSFVEIAKRERADIGEIPPLQAYVEEDESVLVEWVFPYFRVGFNLEANPADSGWHMVSNKKLDEITASGQLRSIDAIIPVLLDFILPNI